MGTPARIGAVPVAYGSALAAGEIWSDEAPLTPPDLESFSGFGRLPFGSGSSYLRTTGFPAPGQSGTPMNSPVRLLSGERCLRQRWVPVVFGVMLGLFAGISVRASTVPPSWSFRSWQASDGLLDNRVTAVRQTPDGYIWIATRGGLVRFNGVDFENFNRSDVEGFFGSGIPAMFSDGSGVLWIAGHREKLLRVGPRSIQVLKASDGVLPGPLCGLADDAQGVTWLAIGRRVCYFDGTRLREVPMPAGGSPNEKASLTRDRRGTVWCSIAGVVGIVSRQGFEERLRLEGSQAVLAPAREGGLWACEDSRIVRISEEGALVSATRLPASDRPEVLLEDRAGFLWIGTASHGLYHFDGREVESVHVSNLDVDSLFEDREGNIWVGTFGGGLDMLRPSAIKLMGPDSGLPFEAVVSFCKDSEGTSWAVASTGQIARGNGGAWTLMPIGGGAATCVTADRRGTVWVGTNGKGLHEVDLRTGAVRTWLQGTLAPGQTIRALLATSDGALWFATRYPTSLGEVVDGKVRMMDIPQGLRNIRSMVQDGHGSVWICSSEGHVLRVAGNQFVSDPALSRMVGNPGRCMCVTPDGVLWIAFAHNGVGFLKDGQFRLLGPAEGIPDSSIWQMAADDEGAIWMFGIHGLFKVDRNQALAVGLGERVGRLRVTAPPQEDELRKAQPNYGNCPAVCKGEDGRIVFSTSLGLLELDPSRFRNNPTPPPVVIERVLVDGKVVGLESSGFRLNGTAGGLVDLGSKDQTLHVPAGVNRVDFNFAALSFSAPQNVQIRYRLEGFEDQWIPSRGERSVHYLRLPAGEYTFRVTASNDSGVWNNVGASLGLSVSPFLWQRAWFRGILVVLFTVAIALIVRFTSHRRLRHLLVKADRETSLLRERSRIARDIHDDLGGGLTHIKLMGEILVKDDLIPTSATPRVQQIVDVTRQLLKSLDETVWAINPRNDTLSNLIGYLGQYTVEFVQAASMRSKVDLPSQLPAISVTSETRHHLYLVIKEALTNAARHSGAATISLRGTVDDHELTLVLEDDGCGFEGQVTDSNADGIINMGRRMASVGGKFDIHSAKGKGTRVTVTIPLRNDEPELGRQPDGR